MWMGDSMNEWNKKKLNKKITTDDEKRSEMKMK